MLLDDIDFEIEHGTGRLLRLSGAQSHTVTDVVDEPHPVLDDDWSF
jgi:hypothetical protein